MFKKLSCCVKKLCSDWMTLLERCRDLHYETVSSCLNFIDLVRSASPAFTKWKLSSTTSRVSFREDSVLDFETCRTIPKGHFFSLSCFHSGSPKVVHLWNEKFGTFKTLFHFLKWLKSCKIKSRIFFCCSKCEHAHKLRIKFYFQRNVTKRTVRSLQCLNVVGVKFISEGVILRKASWCRRIGRQNAIKIVCGISIFSAFPYVIVRPITWLTPWRRLFFFISL